ncbi:hypothetical protein THAOC_22837, partial [Thalassiosira oceanica]
SKMNHPGNGNNPPGGDAAEDSLQRNFVCCRSSVGPNSNDDNGFSAVYASAADPSPAAAVDGDDAAAAAAAAYKDGVELKAAAADFVGISLEKEADVELKPSLKKRTAGAMSVKRKKSAVESASTSSSNSRPCTLCLMGGHNRTNCQRSKEIGTRLTKQKYADKMKLLKQLDEEPITSAGIASTLIVALFLGLGSDVLPEGHAQLRPAGTDERQPRQPADHPHR